MITREEIDRVLQRYDKDKITVGTLGSHSALNIFKGAKEEGLRTVCVCTPRNEIIYRKFPLADHVIIVENFTQLLDEKIQEKLQRLNTILIPHGSFTAYLNTEQLMSNLYVPMFGNRQLLDWEANREKQREWLLKAELKLPRIFRTPREIDGWVIAKFPGARGGRGYFLASSYESFERKVAAMLSRGLVTEADIEKIHLQEYIIGVNVYPHYFHSIIENEVELLGVDRRYESSIDNLGRIPAQEQLENEITPSYTIIGNIPLTLRESLLATLLEMGDKVVETAKRLAYPGIIGPFCLETAITENLEIYTFEISARIVAGTNVGIGTSPYAYLKYGGKMYMGRRIAMEIKSAIEQERINDIVT
jgi:5-formaminoimidazole-4-carboxamide-1-(beta)-D-ribofuranosyl 5'-monophosphate synthetase